MGKKKSPSTGFARPLLDLPTARKIVRAQIEQRVRKWRQENSQLMTRTPGQITIFNDFTLRRQANGSLKLLGPEGTVPALKEMGLSEDELHDWLMQLALMKIRLLMLDELRELTGRKHLSIHDLGSLGQICNRFLNPLITDPHGDIVLSPLKEACIEFLDPAILDLARRARDSIISLATYNLIAAHRTLWEAMAAQTPHLMSLIGHACRKNFIQFDPNALRSLKHFGKRHGLTEAGWKILCKLPAAHILILRQYPLVDCFRLASHYGEAGQIPPAELMNTHIHYCMARGLPLGAIPAWFDAAAIRECARQAATLTFTPPGFVRNEYMIALDWLSHYIAAAGEPDANQKKAGWQWIMRQSDAWHEAQLEEQARRKVITNHQWHSLLKAYQDDGYEVVPLTCSTDLAIEGARMHHCVGSYDHYCRDGRSRIFSIRKDGKRLATAELVKNDGAWLLNQNRGPCNRQPSQQIMEVAHRLQDRYNAATLSK